MRKIHFFAFLVFLMISGKAAGFERELQIYTEQLPPLNYADADTGAAKGFSVDIVKEMLKRTDIRPAGGKIAVYPWTRAYKILEETPDVMLFSMTRTESRIPLFKWVGPIADRKVWMWKMKKREDIIVQTLDGARKYKIGGVDGFAMSSYLKTEGFQVEMVPTIQQNWLKLMKGRIDLGTALEIEASYYMKQLGGTLNDLQKLVLVDDRYEFYIALNPDTSDGLVKKLQKALESMKQDGSYRQIMNQYLYE